MKKQTFIMFFLLCGVGMTIMANTMKNLSNALPGEMNGWEKTAQDTFYNPKTLFKYINGGAELYISYNFKQMLAQKYLKEVDGETAEITVDIFDMGNSYNAFGVFAHSSEFPDKAEDRVGQGSEYASGLLTSWKDKYYISILAYPENEEKKKTVLKIGQAIVNAIPEQGSLPPILSLLPEENLVPGSIRYFYHYIWLNSHYFISDQDILNINPETQAVLAKYKEGGAKFFVLLVTYPGKEKANTAYKSFLNHFLPDAQEGVKQLEDGRWTGSTLEDRLIAVVLDAPNRKTVDGFLKKIKNKRGEK